MSEIQSTNGTESINDAPTTQDYPALPTPEHNGSPILPPDGLTPAQRLAIAALVSGRTFSSAAIQAGVCRKTLYAWRQQPAFAAAVTELSREGLEAAATRARNLMLKATRTLGEAMNGHDRFAWAMRVASNRRLWDAGRELPADLSIGENADVK